MPFDASEFEDFNNNAMRVASKLRGDYFALSNRQREKEIIILMQAKDKITDPQYWLKGSYREGHSFCAVGALRNTIRWKIISGNLAHTSLVEVVKIHGYMTVEGYNDLHTHEQILEVFDTAIDAIRLI